MQESLFTSQKLYPCSAEALYDWHARPGALERLLPPWEKAEILSTSGSISPGSEVKLRMKFGPFPFIFKAKHLQAVPNEMFQDIQIKGPFAKWSHSHFFNQEKGGCLLVDKISYRLPLHNFLPPFVLRLVENDLRKMFIFRDNRLQADIMAHEKYSTVPLRLLITGASGSLGRDLVPFLTTGGHKVWTLVRRQPDTARNEIYWDPEKEILDYQKIPEIDGVIHLAGAYIGLNRWTKKSKEQVLSSRIKGTRLLSETICKMVKRPKVFLCASAVGYYGNCHDRITDENHPPGTDYISEVCSRWEQSAGAVQSSGIRTVFMRLGIGLTPRGGALQRILSTSPLGVHNSIGSGNQYISWVSNDDIISAMLHILATPDLHGPVNIAAPNPVTNREFMQTLAKITGRPSIFPVPAKPLLLIYGQMASEILLSGCRVSTDKLTNSGFVFRHGRLEDALRCMLGRMI